MTTASAAGVNDQRFNDAVKMTRKLGIEAGDGVEALSKLWVLCALQTADGVLSTEEDKHGDGIDDAKHLYGIYVENASKRAVHDHTEKGKKANVSKLRTAIRLGEMSPRIDVKDLIERTVTLRGNAEKAGQDVRPAYPAYIEVARTQLGQETTLSDDEITEAITKPDGAEVTVETIYKRILKLAENLVVGKDGVKDQSDETVLIVTTCKTVLATFGEAAKVKAAEDAAIVLRGMGYEVTKTPAPAAETTEQVAA